MQWSARHRQVVIAWLPVVAYTLLIWWLSSQQIDFRLLDRVPLKDKGVHFLEYGAMSFFVMHAISVTWPLRRYSSVATAVILTMGLGLLDELHQAFVPGRSSDVLDLTADTVGALVAAVCYVGLTATLRALRKDQRPSLVG